MKGNKIIFFHAPASKHVRRRSQVPSNSKKKNKQTSAESLGRWENENERKCARAGGLLGGGSGSWGLPPPSRRSLERDVTSRKRCSDLSGVIQLVNRTPGAKPAVSESSFSNNSSPLWAPGLCLALAPFLWAARSPQSTQGRGCLPPMLSVDGGTDAGDTNLGAFN